MMAGATPSALAAAVRLPFWATATKVSNALSLSINPIIPFLPCVRKIKGLWRYHLS